MTLFLNFLNSFLNIITELISGYAFPGMYAGNFIVVKFLLTARKKGRPIASMCVKIYGYNSVKHGMDFAQDLKLGQYMKIPPRVLFAGQVYSSILATATQVSPACDLRI